MGGDKEADTMSGVFKGSSYFECDAALSVCTGYVDYYPVGIIHRISQGLVQPLHVLQSHLNGVKEIGEIEPADAFFIRRAESTVFVVLRHELL